MARVPQYQPHQTGPATPSPARLNSFDDGGGLLGGIIAGLPRLNKAVADWQAEDQRREVDARARTLAQALQSDVSAAMRGFAALSGREAADAAPALKAQLLALQDAAREQAASAETGPDAGALFDQLSAGPMGRALDQLAEGARRGLRQMGGAAALGERDAAMAAGASAFADPEALLRHRRDMAEANARRAEAEEWDEKRFREEHGRSLSLFHRGVVQAAAEDGDDLTAADAYLTAHRGEMGEKDILLTQELLQARHKLAASQQVVEQAIAAAPSAAEDGPSFDLTNAVDQIKARTDLTEDQRRLALTQVYKRHGAEKAALSARHAEGDQLLKQWLGKPGHERDQLVDLAEVPSSILRQLSPAKRAELELQMADNAARMEREALGSDGATSHDQPPAYGFAGHPQRPGYDEGVSGKHGTLGGFPAGTRFLVQPDQSEGMLRHSTLSQTQGDSSHESGMPTAQGGAPAVSDTPSQNAGTNSEIWSPDNAAQATGDNDTARLTATYPPSTREERRRLDALKDEYKRSNALRNEQKWQKSLIEYNNTLIDIRNEQNSRNRESVIRSLQSRLIRKRNKKIQRENSYIQTINAEEGLRNFFAGRSIEVNEGRLSGHSNDGRPRFNGGSTAVSYILQGPAARFQTADDAAIDAIMFSRTIAQSVGSNGERGGFIVKNDDGTFGYQYPININGQTFQKPYSIVGEFGGSLDMQVPANAVGIWHTHPRSDAGDNMANIYFGPNDIIAAHNAGKGSSQRITAYLGGSDGGVRALDNLDRYPANLNGTAVPPSDYRTVGNKFYKF